MATGLAGVGAGALWFLLDSDWRAVKRHRCKRQKTEMRAGTQTTRFVCSSLIQVCPSNNVIRLKGKSKYFCLQRHLIFFFLHAIQKCLSNCPLQNTGQDRQTRINTHLQENMRSHTTAFLQSFGSPKCPRPLFFTLPDTTAAKTSSVKVKLKAKQLYGPRRRPWTDESKCHTSVRTAYTPMLCCRILSYWHPDVSHRLYALFFAFESRTKHERTECITTLSQHTFPESPKYLAVPSHQTVCQAGLLQGTFALTATETTQSGASNCAEGLCLLCEGRFSPGELYRMFFWSRQGKQQQLRTSSWGGLYLCVRMCVSVISATLYLDVRFKTQTDTHFQGATLCVLLPESVYPFACLQRVWSRQEQATLKSSAQVITYCHPFTKK